MSLGQFGASFLKGFMQAKQNKTLQDQDKKEKDARLKLFEVQLEREKAAQQQQQVQSDQLQQQLGARQQIFDRLGGMETMPGTGVKVADPTAKTPSLTELLADPENAMQLLQSGLVSTQDLTKMSQQQQMNEWMKQIMGGTVRPPLSMDMGGGAAPGGMKLSGLKIDSSGQPMLDFTKPGSVQLLEALRDDPALAEVDASRRKASASQINVGDQGMTKPPTGFYRPDPKKPGLQIEPGGPIAKEQKVNVSQANAAMESSTYALDRLSEAATSIKDNPALWRVAGLAGALPNAPGSAAADLQAEFENLSSQVAFGVLQAMREASKTGGALGAVSEKELKLLESNLAALDKKQSPESYRKNLQKIIEYTQTTKTRLAEAFDRSYGGENEIDFSDLPD